ncbi:MAG: hypothetical protein ACYDDF_06230 [Thermoplasmatota archaeon]
MHPAPPSDRHHVGEFASAATIASVLLCLLTIACAATVYAMATQFTFASTAPHVTLRWTSAHSGLAAAMITSATPGTLWNSVQIQLKSPPTRYGILVSAAGCSSFATSAPWSGPRALGSAPCPLSSGDIVEVGIGTAGHPTLVLTNARSNDILSEVTLPPLAAQTLPAAPIASCSVSRDDATLAEPVFLLARGGNAGVTAAQFATRAGPLSAAQIPFGGTHLTKLEPALSPGSSLQVSGTVWDLYGWQASPVATACSP